MITVKNLHKRYKMEDKYGLWIELDAVKQVSFSLQDGVSYALIGESGSGKSTLARMLMGIERASSGEVWLDETDITAIRRTELRKLRAKFQMVLQNSQSALDPRRTIYESIAEPLRCLTQTDRKTEWKKVLETVDKVQLSPVLLDRLPHELSGGQLQRVCIARAIILSPKFIVFDESVSGLDVTIRKQILDLIVQLKQEEGSSFLFITHDIDVALYIARNIFVMKHGEIIEHIEQAGSYADFQHDYSRLLIDSLPPKAPKLK